MKFINNSTADESAGAELVKYKWDFDISSPSESADSNGDGIKDNDIDSTEKDPEFTYEKSGIYRAKLTVEDNLGNKSEIINFVNVKPDSTQPQTVDTLTADFTTVPSVDPTDNAIHLSGDFDEVRFNFIGSTGDIVKYVFDNNIYIDSNENGRKADDEDYVTTVPGVYTTTFNPEADRIKVRLTVYDKEGNIAIKEVRIVFDNKINDIGVNILGVMPQNQISAIVVSIVLFAIVSLSLYIHSERLEGSRKKK